MELRLLGWVVVVTQCVALSASAASDPTWRRFRGQIVFQSTPFADFDTSKAFTAMVAKARRNKSLARDSKGTWNLHFIAFMRSAPGADKVNLVWYKRKGRKFEQTDYTEFVVPPNEVTLKAKLRLTEALGYQPGDTYELRLTRLLGGKEKVYAKCRITLK
jgi:hypothetical protein